MQPLPSHTQFLVRLEALLREFGHIGTGEAAGSGISSNKVVYSSVKKRTIDDYMGEPVDEDWDHPRKIAYLACYVESFGPRFSYERFDFAEGQMHSDKANMKTHLKYGCIEAASDGHFALTDKGQALIAPFVKVPAAQMEAAHAR